MKRFAYYIACCSLVALCGCSYDDIDDVAGDLNNGKITIEASLGDLAITRAEDTSKERTVEYIDVFAVDEDDNITYHERNTSSGNESGKEANGAGKLTLNAARRTKIDNEFVFAQGEKYKFYLVANSTVSEETMGGLATLRDLELLVQDNSFDPGLSTGERQTLLHLSGTSQGTNEDGYVAPQTFLMDAVATDANGNDEWVVNPATGNLTNLELAAEFKRAAAKIVVNITQGEDVEFHTELEGQDSQYDFYKLPSNTFVLPSEQPLIGIELINTAPMGPNAETFIWGSTTPAASNTIQIIGYAYAHQWSDVDLTNETSLILNIPMMWNKDDSDDKSKEEAAPSSWYKVPLSKEKKFERNKCYMVNITINAVGAANRSTAIELRDIEYVTLDWEDVNIEVGNEDNKPAYLELNTDLVEMYNVNFDNSSLSFASSSAIKSVTLKDVYSQNSDGTFTSATDNYYAYYINKFGVKTNLSDAIIASVSATAEQDVLNGGINILSPILNTTVQERELALEALGEEPTVPAEPDAEGKPNPNDYLGANTDYPTTLPTASSTYYNQNYTIYRYNEETGTFQSNTYTGTRSGRFNNYTYSWNNGSGWVDVNAPESYNTALNAWAAQHPEYQEYLNAVAKYDAYQAAIQAIENSATAGETHYNTIRYLEFEVENMQGIKATFRVMQYPVIYITNQQGWYSYREDFGSSYETKGDRNVRIRLSMTNNSWNGDYLYDTTAGTGYNTGTTYFWQSKVVSSYNDETGKSTTSFYSWSQNSNAATATTGGNCETNTNARMYHVRVTATSDTYTIGRPRLDSSGFTAGDAANAKLVSPSFMIASRLGAIYSTYGGLGSIGNTTDGNSNNISDRLEIFRDHCKNYVEVYKDANGNGVILDDWRLPTEAEIKIIIDLQGTENQDAPAIDYLLNGGYYMSASGPVKNSKGDSNDDEDESAIRCIRDAY